MTVAFPPAFYGLEFAAPCCTHKLVPRRTDILRTYVELDGNCDGVTTLMIKNVPNKFNKITLLLEIDQLGFAGKYDFFYMPMDLVNKCNVGYAFINFVNPSDCAAFSLVLREYRFRTFRSRKLGTSVPAHIQGLESNLRHFSKTRVMGWDEFKPLVLPQSEPEYDQNVTELADALQQCLEMCAANPSAY